ncbi:hypothetical protein ACLMJK_006646 [Lecanora helva]
MPTIALETYGFPREAFDPNSLPDFTTEFLDEADLEQFAKALNAPVTSPVVALNDWRPVYQRVKRRRPRTHRKPRRTKDESREGFVYSILKWPLLLLVCGWIFLLGVSYLATRTYIWAYEHLITWRGKRQALRKSLRSKTNYNDWRVAARELDAHLGNEQWKETDDYAYYDYTTVTKVKEQLKAARALAKSQRQSTGDGIKKLKSLVEACVKNNFVGVENSRLYSETYYGTKHLAQGFVDELQASLVEILHSSQISKRDKYVFAKQLHTNFGRTALCLSGGASFAYYHLGVVRALLDASLLPEVITGTSGGALVAALVATRTDKELDKLLVPALSHRIKACEETFLTWAPRWWRTGARFDSLQWARQCSWFCKGSTTFREAFEHTGRILNVSCVPSDPHTPTILANYLTAPDCVIWSAVLASAAVPGILNPVVLMMKLPDGRLAPYSFGHKWKDGSLRTDVPIQSLNRFFDVNFSIVSQVNPHVNLFVFSSRGTVGRPVTHRKGRGWRGGFFGSLVTTWLLLELQKFLKISKHLELLPRPMGQDWSGIWLQKFEGKITIWPKTSLSDFYFILSDPSPERLARMLVNGQQATFPKLLFIENRLKIENLIEDFLAQEEPGKIGHTDYSPDRSAPTSDGDEKVAPRYVGRRPSVIEEIRRQSGVFFDDSEMDGEESGISEEEEIVTGEELHDRTL